MSSARGGHAVYPAPSKDSPTTPPGNQTNFDSRRDAQPLSLRDFELPGMGEPSETCGKDRMPEKNAICPNGDAVRYEPLRCRRVACPECYSSEDREQAFRICVELEAAARVRGERPHAVVFSVPPSEGRGFSIDDINTELFRRGYRRAGRRCEIEGGYAVFHPARLPNRVERALRAEGYGPDGDLGGYWGGVRADALELGDWREYAEYSPHGHSVGFPGWIEPHEGEDYVIRKYDQLGDVEAVVNHTRYLMTHRGTFGGEGTLRAIRSWGLMHHAADGWDGAEAELGAEEYAEVADAVAGVMGGEWSPEEGLYYPDDGGAECPECGTPKRDFIDLWDLPSLASSKNQGGLEWMNRLTDGQRAFFQELIEILHHERAPRLHRGDITHPNDVAVWIDADRPPPESGG